MTDHSGEFNDLDNGGLLHLHTLASRFESAWNSDQRPRLEDCLADADPSDHRTLLELLIPIDIRCRRLRGEQPQPADYSSCHQHLTSEQLRAMLAPVSDADASAFTLTGDDAAESTVLQMTAADLLQRVRDSQIVAAETLTQFTDSSSPDDIRKQLVDQGLLTPFQFETIVNPSGLPVLLGDYVLLDQIGQGGMGTVLRARHRRMKRIVAIKILRRQAFHDTESVLRFNREVELAAQLSHPNIVTAYDAGEHNGLQFLVTEFIDGEDLAEIVLQQGPFSLTDAVDIIRQAAAGLDYAHRKGIIHRDIKPANLLLDDEGGVKLLDVGLARLVQVSEDDDSDLTELTASGLIMGTVNYMSPEQADSTHDADERSDLYSLGCTLWFLLTGAAPYAAGSTMQRLMAHRESPVPSLRQFSDDVPQPLDDLCRQLLAKNPAERPDSAARLCERLDELLQTDLPDLVLPAAGHDLNHPTMPVQQADAERFEDPQQFRDSTLVMTQTDPDRRSAVTSGSSSRSSAVMPLLSVVLPGMAAVALVMWWFGNRHTALDSSGLPPSPGEAIQDSDRLIQLTDLSIDDVRDWRVNWSESHNLPLSSQLNGIDFELIPPGRFVMGDDSAGEVVEVRDAFYLSATEVTVGQFAQFAEETGHETVIEGWGWDGSTWDRRPGWGWNNAGRHPITDQHPAASIRFTDAQAFCSWMSDRTGRDVRLPTEVEWEYACRCGRAGRWSFGNSEAEADLYAWSENQSDQQMHPVGQLRPNAWELYDMHGNESEWCLSEFADVGPHEAVVRGGGFNTPLSQCTSASRLIQERTTPSHGAFRILLDPE